MKKVLVLLLATTQLFPGTGSVTVHNGNLLNAVPYTSLDGDFSVLGSVYLGALVADPGSPDGVRPAEAGASGAFPQTFVVPGDMTVSGDLVISAGSSIEVKGNLLVSGKVSIQGNGAGNTVAGSVSKLKVGGTFQSLKDATIFGGIISVGGDVDVGGDLVIARKTETTISSNLNVAYDFVVIGNSSVKIGGSLSTGGENVGTAKVRVDDGAKLEVAGDLQVFGRAFASLEVGDGTYSGKGKTRISSAATAYLYVSEEGSLDASVEMEGQNWIKSEKGKVSRGGKRNVPGERAG